MSSNNENINASSFQNLYQLPICSVCFDVLNNDLSVTHCGHVFHNTCIEKCIRASQQCPNDRSFLYDVIKIKFDIKSRIYFKKGMDSLDIISTSNNSNIFGTGSVEVHKSDKIKEIINMISKYKADCNFKEENLKAQISSNDKLKSENEKLIKDLDIFMNQNKEIKKRIVSYKNKCDGYEEELNNIKIELSEKKDLNLCLSEENEILKDKLNKIQYLDDLNVIINKFDADEDNISATIKDMNNRIGGIKNVELYVHKIQVDYSALKEDARKLKEDNKRLKEELNHYSEIALPERKKKSIGDFNTLFIHEIQKDKEKINDNNSKKNDNLKANDFLNHHEMILIDSIDKKENDTIERNTINPFFNAKTAELHQKKLLNQISKNSISSCGKQTRLISLITTQMKK